MFSFQRNCLSISSVLPFLICSGCAAPVGMVESLASFAAAVAKYPREVATCQYKWYNGPKTAFLTDQMALAEEEVVCPHISWPWMPGPPATGAFCLTGRGMYAAWPKRSSPSFSPNRAGWSTTPRRFGQYSWRWPSRPCGTSARQPRTLPPLASPTSGKPPWFGTKKQAAPSVRQSSGSAAGPPGIATA